MSMRKRHGALFAAFFSVFSGVQALAGYTTFDFASVPGFESGDPLTFSKDDIVLSVGGSGYYTPGSVGEEVYLTDPFDVQRQEHFGLFANTGLGNQSTSNNCKRRCDDHRVDGYWNELLTFSFSQDVVITSVTFDSYTSGNHDFDYYVADGTALIYRGGETVTDEVTGFSNIASMFHGIGASDDDVAFKIRQMIVSYDSSGGGGGGGPLPAVVPLPASGLLLASVLGSAVIMRRRQRRAA
jgi:hypothetical protein